MKKIWLLVILIAWTPLFIAAWDNDLPADSSPWNNGAGFIRDNWDHLETQFGEGITGNLQVDIVEITSAEIKDLADMSIELVSAPGADKVLDFAGATLVLDFGTNVLVESNDNLIMRYDDGSAAVVSEIIEMTGFIDSEADAVTFAIPVKDPIGTSNSQANKNIALLNNAGDFTGNSADDSTLRIMVAYRIHSLVEQITENIVFNGENVIFAGEQVAYP